MASEHDIVDLREVLTSPGVAQLITGLRAPTESLLATHERHPSTRVALGVLVENQLVAAIIARTPHFAICEILATGGEFDEYGDALIEAAAAHFNALAVWAVVDARDVTSWEARGFVCRPDDDGAQWYRAEIRRPPEPADFHTVAEVQVRGERSLAVELPPEGNTLPLVPKALHGLPVPPFVLSWILDTDEVFLMLQDVVPELFPPVTPAARPPSIRDALGSLGDTFGDPRLDDLSGDDPIPDLPVGVNVPVRILEIAAAMDRAKAWLMTARRVRSWAAEHGAEAESWVEHATWQVHDLMRPELLEVRLEDHD